MLLGKQATKPSGEGNNKTPTSALNGTAEQQDNKISPHVQQGLRFKRSVNNVSMTSDDPIFIHSRKRCRPSSVLLFHLYLHHKTRNTT